MSGFFDSETITMPGLSMRDIESIGEDLLQEVEPSALTEPTQLDVLDWSDHKLQTIGFHVVPVRRSELELHNCREGMADHRGRPGDPIELLIEDEFFSELIEGGRLANRARAIIIHELSHGILHVPLLRQYQYDLEELSPMVQQDGFFAAGGRKQGILIIIPVIAPPHKENSRVMPKAAICTPAC